MRTAEQAAQNVQAVVQGGGAEEYPTDRGERESERDAQRIDDRPALALADAEQALEGEQGAVIAAPDDEVPARTVPQAAEQHRQQQVAIRLPSSVAIAAERNIQ